MPRYTVRVAVFVVLRRWKSSGSYEIYFMRRAGTSHENGKFGLPSGHVEAEEAPIEAAFRELREETGMEIPMEAFRLIHTQFNRGGGEGKEDYINLFFAPEAWTGIEPRITEPDKCSEARWLLQAEALSSPEVVPYVRRALFRFYDYQDRYSETVYNPRV